MGVGLTPWEPREAGLCARQRGVYCNDGGSVLRGKRRNQRAGARCVNTTAASENVPFSVLINLPPCFGQKFGPAGILACSKKEHSPSQQL